MPIKKTTRKKMTREQFLSQAESIKPGLTKTRFIQAILKDVNTCEYLAIQNQMYSIPISEEDIEQAMERANNLICSRIFPRGEFYIFDNVKEAMNTFGVYKNVEAYELAYAFLRNDMMKEMFDRYTITKKGFIEICVIKLIPPTPAESVVKENKMTREEFLSQAKSVKPGLTESQFIQAIIKDVYICEYLAEQNQMYPIPISEEDVNNLVGEYGMSGIKAKVSKSNQHIYIRIKKSQRVNAEIVNGIKAFELAYVFLTNELMKDALEKYCINQEEFIRYGVLETMKSKGSDDETSVITPSISITPVGRLTGGVIDEAAEEVIDSLEAGETATQDDNTVQNKPDKSPSIKYSLRFPNRGDVPIEESNKIAKILSSPEIQEELKKFKIRKRNSEDGYRFEELVDYEFDKEKYDYAFGIDSMRKGKKIVILFNVNGDKVPADIFFVDDDN